MHFDTQNNINKRYLYKKTLFWQKIMLILLGLFLTMLILEMGLRISGFIMISLQERRNLQSIKENGKFRIMCLGESTTQNQYPAYLEEILNKRNIGVKFSVLDKGRAGLKTAEILAQLEANLDAYQPDMIVTMMGVNDGRGNHLPYEAESSLTTTLIFKSLKVYKLIRLIWLHMITKLKETGFFIQIRNNQFTERARQSILEDKSGKAHNKQDLFFAPEQSFKKAIALNPKNVFIYYIELGRFYKEQGKFAESEEMLKKAIALNPKNDSAYVELGILYRDQWKNFKSIQAFKKAIELNYRNYYAYEILGWLYREEKAYADSEQAFKKAIEIYPGSNAAYVGLGRLYREQGKYADSEQAYKTAIELNPKNDCIYEGLGRLYREQGKYADLEQVFKKAIELNPECDLVCAGLAVMYYETGKNKLYKVYAEKVDKLRDKYYNPATINNYLRLKEILDRRKVKLVCAQYPMRNIAQLKKIFGENTQGNIIFVDNERIFKEAVRKEGYNEYFVDMFSGDFGHCTEKGNRLLAENIANVILKEIFGK